jgi:hypothetical protein
MKLLAIALGALVLGGCAGTSESIRSNQHAYIEPPVSAVATVRLRTESEADKMQRAAYLTVWRLLREENYDVVGPSASTFDVDMAIGSRSYEDANGTHTTITLSSRAGRHVIEPLAAEFVSNDGTIDEPSLVDACMAWKRSYMRWTQAVRRHREMVAADQKSELGHKPMLVGTLDGSAR